MKLFIDQMFTIQFTDLLRRAGHDVVRTGEIGKARADDAEVLEAAIAEGRVLVTLDAHFGDWTVLPLKEHCGVIRLRTHPTTTENAFDLLQPFLAGLEQADFINNLVIVSPTQVRWIDTAGL
jgi:predicted nuclease of predicted toxin-antitoxin system